MSPHQLLSFSDGTMCGVEKQKKPEETGSCRKKLEVVGRSQKLSEEAGNCQIYGIFLLFNDLASFRAKMTNMTFLMFL